MNNERTAGHQRPEKLERLLDDFAALLGPIEQREVAALEPCDEPILYVMGCARSGTTLVYQYLSQTGLFAFPSNFVSRFYYAPYLGARLQQMLYECDFRGEITGDQPAPHFDSLLGKTKGARSPHEFWYFWRRFFNFGDIQQLSGESLVSADGAGFIRELRAFQSVLAQPLVLKGMILNWHIPYLASLFEKSYFVVVERDVADNAESLLHARREFSGDENAWYSFKPPGYEHVLPLAPPQQVAWQVMATNSAIRDGISAIPRERVITVSYENFCTSPQSLLDEIADKCGLTTSRAKNELPESFNIRQRQERDWERIMRDVEPLLP